MKDDTGIDDAVIDGLLEFHFRGPGEPLEDSPAVQRYLEWLEEGEEEYVTEDFPIAEIMGKIRMIHRMREAAEATARASSPIPLATLLLDARVAAGVDAAEASELMGLRKEDIAEVEGGTRNVLELSSEILSRMGETLGLQLEALRRSLAVQIGLGRNFFEATAFARSKASDLVGDRARLETQRVLLRAYEKDAPSSALNKDDAGQLREKMMEVERIWEKGP